MGESKENANQNEIERKNGNKQNWIKFKIPVIEAQRRAPNTHTYADSCIFLLARWIRQHKIIHKTNIETRTNVIVLVTEFETRMTMMMREKRRRKILFSFTLFFSFSFSFYLIFACSLVLSMCTFISFFFFRVLFPVNELGFSVTDNTDCCFIFMWIAFLVLYRGKSSAHTEWKEK